MRSTFVCAGTGDVETYRTHFSYYGFRFVQVTNFPGVPDASAITGHFLHSFVGGDSSGLSSSNDVVNSIQHLTRMASLSNLMDVPTDCPQREVRSGMRRAALAMRSP